MATVFKQIINTIGCTVDCLKLHYILQIITLIKRNVMLHFQMHYPIPHFLEIHIEFKLRTKPPIRSGIDISNIFVVFSMVLWFTVLQLSKGKQ